MDSCPFTGMDSSLGLQELEDRRISVESGHTKVTRWSSLRTYRLYSQQNS